MLVNKTDLLPHLAFDIARCEEAVRMVNPAATILRISATAGERIQAWCDWIAARKQAVRDAAFT